MLFLILTGRSKRGILTVSHEPRESGISENRLEENPVSRSAYRSPIFSPPPSQLVAFEDRVTYVFTHGKEIGSLHFDHGRGEIFYKGHNVRNMEVEDWQWQVMEEFRGVLSADEKCKRFVSPYGKTLHKMILEKKRQQESESKNPSKTNQF